MFQLVEFLSRNRNFILFVLLETLSFWLIVQSNSYWSATYFNTSNYYVAKALTLSNTVREYATLREVNADLAAENVRLNTLVTQLQQQRAVDAPPNYQPDSLFSARFTYVVAKVINNETNRANNYITIDKGTLDGVQPGMGVISATGVVGKVRFCSEHFSVITSILHAQFMVSTRLVRSDEIGTAKWPGKSPDFIDLIDVSRYKTVEKGDSAVTSNLNAVFPPGIMVGTVENLTVRPDQTFYDISLRLSTDFRNMSYVYVVKNQLRPQLEELQKRLETERR
ncbi:rod shape-determining protein MreC [Rhabdobacter roseus]|uniref:Cell shape-determining protein MreC n=1 Tax=Rhabdobacter roseus TaxID=1655419 RepID=A0A840TQ81_9BACT|nr:rod shape-determining protein MreC [Rhabdobacter roseus]MBB5282210.1 rod shape-determining protein MreC [Rhabdobacter roseus]